MTAHVGRREFLAGSLAAIGLSLAGCSDESGGRPQQPTTRPTTQPTRPTGPNLRFGLDTSINDESISLAAKYRQVRAAYGGTLGAHTKFFDMGRGWTESRQNMLDMGWGSAPGEVRPVLCARAHDDGAFEQLITDMASVGQWYACFYQEVNDDIRDGTISVAEYRAVWPRLDALRKAHPHGAKVRLLPIMNGYAIQDQGAQARAGGYDAVTLCRDLPMDGIGFDVYDNKWRTASSWTPARYFEPAQQAAAALGVKWSIPEFGLQVSRVSDDDEQGRADRLRAVIEYCKSNPSFDWLNYWEGKGRAGNWTLIGSPAQQVMEDAVNSSR
jgi:hypothetical protein